MATKTYEGRILHKHDTEVNWNKATNFVPLASELIIYDEDEDHEYPRVKVGDGETNVKGLPFICDYLEYAVNTAQVTADNAQTVATAALPKTGGEISGNLSVTGVITANKIVGAVYQ